MKNIWLVGDTHFYHTNIIKYCNRPFSSIDEMNEKLIENWNRVVKASDTVYHLGDFGFAKKELLLAAFKRLNGNKHLIRGNHDKDSLKLPWASQHDLFDFSCDDKFYALCHYPLRTWNKSFHGARMCHGHTHGMLKPWGWSCDVGVDCWDFTPVNVDTLEQLFAKLPRYVEEEANASRGGQIWQGRQCMLTFKDAFFGDGTYDKVDPDEVAKKDPDTFKKDKQREAAT
jgi:calcineurin-like phosphoesterase family protein